jgi:hypothetical protein
MLTDHKKYFYKATVILTDICSAYQDGKLFVKREFVFCRKGGVGRKKIGERRGKKEAAGAIFCLLQINGSYKIKHNLRYNQFPLRHC